MPVKGHCFANIKWEGQSYKANLLVADCLLAPVVFGLDLLAEHKALTVKFGGEKPPVTICMPLKSIKCQAYELLPGIDLSRLKLIVISSRPIPHQKQFVDQEIQ